MEKRHFLPLVSLMILSIMCMIFISTVQVHAENKDYHSGAGIGFYGEYRYPDEPSEIGDRTVEGETPPPTEEDSVVESKPSSSYPKTGEKSNSFLSLLGGALLVSTGCVLFYKKRKTKH